MRLTDLYEPAATGVLKSMDIFMMGYRKAQFLADDKAALERLAQEQQWKHSFDFSSQLFRLGSTVLVTTPQLRIVFASSSIAGLTGYTPEEVLGNTPALFQGKKTSTLTKSTIRRSVEKRVAFAESVINYRKNGSLYHCHIKGYPLFNRNKELVNFIAFENQVENVL